MSRDSYFQGHYLKSVAVEKKAERVTAAPGWFWIPGRTWGAAWVSWASAPGYVSWCPLGWNNRPLIQINVFSGRDRWHPWTVVPRRHFGAGYVYKVLVEEGKTQK